METNNLPSLAEVLGTLNELAAAAHADDAERYRAALTVADRQGLHDDQVKDAYRLGRTRRGRVHLAGGGNRPRNIPEQLGSIDQLD